MHCLSRPMPEAHPMIGQPIRRKEDPHFLRGGGRYVHDLTSPGLLHLAFVRSPYAHAAVHAIDATRARRLPGAPLEGRGIVAQWGSTGRLTVWASTQVPHLMRTGLARFLGVPETVV